MNSLVSYGIDDDYDDSSEEKQTDWRGISSKSRGSSAAQTDANYEEVQMDLSEGSNDSKPEVPIRRSRERDSRDRRGERERESRDSRDSRDSRESRERERERERNRYERDKRSSSSKDNERLEKSSSRDYNYSRRDRDKDRERERDRDRERDRKSKRSSSRERRKSRTPPKRSDRDSKRSKSRSRSRDRSRKYSKRYDRRSRSRGRDEKIEPQRSTIEDEKKNNPSEGDRFFMPGITGRFRDQIERRKQLWQKKDTAVPENKNGQTKKVWEATTFAQDSDGKVANKFKRLMGIRNTTEAGGQSTDVLKKQEEMFSSMEQQYEVARTATHTMRGVGLGFGSYQR